MLLGKLRQALDISAPVGVVLDDELAPVPPSCVSKYENPPEEAPLPVLLPYGNFQPLGQMEVPAASDGV